MLMQSYVDRVITTALEEDIHYLDVTSDYLIDENAMGHARFVAKAQGVLCGIDIACRVFQLLDPAFSATLYKKDGDPLQVGDCIMKFSGHTRQLLKGERTALNLVQHLSGIATATHTAVKLTEGTSTTISDTRKTLPGLRTMQKYAVTVGGGKNHRYNLSDAAMLKDNHIDAAGGITPAIEKLRQKIGHMTKIEVETRTLAEVEEALAAGADIIMLDNMDLDTMRQAVALNAGRVKLEASGNITPQRVQQIAEIGVDIISMGALTHSVEAFDISMRIDA